MKILIKGESEKSIKELLEAKGTEYRIVWNNKDGEELIEWEKDGVKKYGYTCEFGSFGGVDLYNIIMEGLKVNENTIDFLNKVCMENMDRIYKA